jgi:sec-independent protein translocase protein TatA
MPFELGIPEVILVLVIALVFLGPKRLPEAGHAIGRGIREFRAGVTGLGDDQRPVAELPPAPPAYTPPRAYIAPPGGAAAYTPPPGGEEPGETAGE